MRQVRARPSSKKERSGGRDKDTRGAAARSVARAKNSTRRSRFGDNPISRYIAHVRDGSRASRPMLVFTLLLMLGGGGAGLLAGGYLTSGIGGVRDDAAAAFAAAGFTVGRIAIEGNERTPAAEVYEALGIAEGDSIFAADPGAARARLRQLPWVSDAVVRRRFPDTVSVRLFEKRPFALWRMGADIAVVERSGAVIAGAEAGAFARLPILIGDGAPEAAAPVVDALAAQRALGSRVRGLERISERRWDLILDRGVRVRLPEEGWEAELAELERLIVEEGVLERDIEIIDLRFPDSYIFQLHNGDSRPVSRDRPV